jgi:hypothetical protein
MIENEIRNIIFDVAGDMNAKIVNHFAEERLILGPIFHKRKRPKLNHIIHFYFSGQQTRMYSVHSHGFLLSLNSCCSFAQRTASSKYQKDARGAILPEMVGPVTYALRASSLESFPRYAVKLPNVLKSIKSPLRKNRLHFLERKLSFDSLSPFLKRIGIEFDGPMIASAFAPIGPRCALCFF